LCAVHQPGRPVRSLVSRRILVTLELVTGVTGLAGGALLAGDPHGALPRAGRWWGEIGQRWRAARSPTGARPAFYWPGWSEVASCRQGGGNGVAAGMPASCR